MSIIGAVNVRASVGRVSYSVGEGRGQLQCWRGERVSYSVGGEESVTVLGGEGSVTLLERGEGQLQYWERRNQL